MAQTTTIPAPVRQRTVPLAPPARGGSARAVVSLWWREVIRFYRQRSRVVGVILSPLVFWLVIGSGFGSSFRSDSSAGGQHYLEFFYPGALIMIVLFTSIFTMMSVIEDRKEGFLLSVLVAPIHRSVIVLAKVLGGTTLSAIQGLIFLIFAPLIGAHIGIAQFGLVVLSGVPGVVLPHGAGIRRCVEDGIGTRFSRCREPVPDPVVASFGRVVSGPRCFGLDSLAHVGEPADVRYRSVARGLFPATADPRFPAWVIDCSTGRILRRRIWDRISVRQPAKHEAGGMSTHHGSCLTWTTAVFSRSSMPLSTAPAPC